MHWTCFRVAGTLLQTEKADCGHLVTSSDNVFVIVYHCCFGSVVEVTSGNTYIYINVGKSTVHNIVKKKAKNQTFLTEIQEGHCIKKRRIVRRTNIDALDKAVYLWFVQQCCKGAPISGPLLMGKALQLFPLVYPDDHDLTFFKAGTGWLKRFKDRHGIRVLSVQEESQSAASSSVDPSRKIFRNSLRRRA